MVHDTKIGGSQSQFPATRWSAIVATRSNDPSERRHAFEAIVATYWKPVYKYIRMKWHMSNEDAKDLTQGFFTTAIEKEYLQGFDPTKARFRTFLRTCLDGFVANEEKAAHRIKRGGGAKILSLDFDSAENEMKFAQIPTNDSMDDYFDKEWIRSLFSVAVEELRKVCETKNKSIYFSIFERYDLSEASSAGKLTYDDLASEFKLPTTKVTNYLAYARREFRRILLDKLREITLTEEEFQSEARSLLGMDLR